MKKFKRQFIKKEEWKRKYIFTRFILPFLVFIGLLGILMGNRDTFFIFIEVLMATILFITYTKPYGKDKNEKQKRDKEGNNKIKKVTRVVMEIVLVLVSIFVIYDTARYTVAMTQVQFENEGYVTGNVRSGGYEGNMYIEEKEGSKEYKHVFEGWKYLSKVEVKKDED